MKKAPLILLLSALLPAAVLAEEKTDESVTPSPEIVGAIHESPLRQESLYTVSSDDLDASESLNRIAGHIDLGFSAPSQSFQSPDHYKSGPFGRDEQSDPH